MSTLWEAISSPANFPNYDARSDLGIGSLRAKTHFQRQSQSTYPYIEPSSSENDIENEDDEDAEPIDKTKFMNKIGRVIPSDPYAVRSVDNQYYTPSASTPFHLSKLGEAIGSRSSATNLSPIPDLYSNKQATIGGSNSWNAVHKQIQHSKGTKRGWSMAPVPIPDEKFASEQEKNDDFKVVSLIRQIVNAYHDANMQRK